MHYIHFLAFGIGFVSGLRSLTAPAAVSWAGHLGWPNLQASPFAFMASTAAVAIFSLLAILEYVADKLPRTPSRTTPGPLVARIVLGGLSGACLSVSVGQSWLTGAILGGLGGAVGAFAGYEYRRQAVAALGVKDAVPAVLEDLVAIGLAALIVSR